MFPFTTPFLYDPAAGNLVLDLQIEANGSAITFDTVSGNPAIGRVFNFGSSTATTGDLRASHVTQFTFEPPPLVTIRASQVEVCWNSISNLTYQVQYRSDLTTNLWTSLGDCIRSTDSTSCISDPDCRGSAAELLSRRPDELCSVTLTGDTNSFCNAGTVVSLP